MKLPTLYKLGLLGAVQEWSIRTEGATIVTAWGQIGGSKQTTNESVKGKNIGRSNETTPEQQAEMEATSRWTLKKRKHLYVESIDDAKAGKTDSIIEGGISPMLAHRYDEHSKKIQWPAFTQPKLDGHRCTVVVEGDYVSMWSRTRKPIHSLPHIIDCFRRHVHGRAIFDGELYSHDYRDRFEELTSFIRPQKPKEGHEVVEYWVYDCCLPDDPFYADRLAALQDFFAVLPSTEPVKEVPTVQVADEEDLMSAYHGFLEGGFEGAMVRNANGLYVGRRSYDLQKVKTMQDAEFEIVGVETGKGRMADKAIFVCQTPSGATFNVKMAGSMEELKKFVKNPSLAIGHMLTVQFFETTGANGVPRFPVGLRLREEI